MFQFNVQKYTINSKHANIGRLFITNSLIYAWRSPLKRLQSFPVACLCKKEKNNANVLISNIFNYLCANHNKADADAT